MRTRSIRLSDKEAAQFEEYAALHGEIETTLLKKAALRGLQELRLERAIQHYPTERDSSAAADIAGLPRAIFLQVLMDKGVVILDEPPRLLSQLEGMAASLGSKRLAGAVRKVAEGAQCSARNDLDG